MDTVDILCSFIKAERASNWNLHMSAIRSILPYLASSGHHINTKSACLYLQMMSKVEINTAHANYDADFH